MTSDEFVQKYGKVKVKFQTYYKYSFTFVGKLDTGETITVRVGGDSSEIYRFEVSADSIYTVSELYPYAGHITSRGLMYDDFYDY